MRPRLPAAMFPKRSSNRSARRARHNRNRRVQSAQQCSQPQNRLLRGVLLDVCKQRRNVLPGPEQVVGLLTVRCVVAPKRTPHRMRYKIFCTPLQPQGDDFPPGAPGTTKSTQLSHK